MNAPVQIGDTVYEARAWPYAEQQQPCPVCFGQLFATLVLGNGEHVTVECDACGLGYDGPRGWINAPAVHADVHEFTVSGIDRRGEQWYIFGEGHARKWGDEVFATRAEAEVVRDRLYTEALATAEQRGLSTAALARKRLTWQVRYHREQIKNATRDLAWHTRKLSDALARSRKKEGD